MTLCLAPAGCTPTPSANAESPIRTSPSAAGSSAGAAKPLERGGMWMPSQMGFHADELRRLGLTLAPERLMNPREYPLDAVVFLGGCSASFVSPQGLIVTNHHCAVDALQYNSRPGQDLVENGFLARSQTDERSNGPAARVFITERQTDVTTRMLTGTPGIEDDRAFHLELEKRSKQLVAECEREAPNTRCLVAGFFGGASYVLVQRLELKDVRLVYSPPDGTGRFGGDIDNWQWPRHTGDYAFFRAYVGQDGKPAEYSPDNVPYQPKHHLKLASRPLAENDLVFVAGYPAHTEQLATPFEIAELVDWYFPRQIAYCAANLEAIENAWRDDEDARLKGVPIVRGLSNWKKSMEGALEGLSRGGAAKRKQKQYDAFEAWVSSHEGPAAAEHLRQLEAALVDHAETREARAGLSEMLHASPLLSSAIRLVRLAKEKEKPDPERKPTYQERNFANIRAELLSLDQLYSKRLDVARLVLALRRGAATVASDRSPAFDVFLTDPSQVQDLKRATEKLFRETRLDDRAERMKWFDATWEKIERSRDPMLRVARGLLPSLERNEAQEEAFEGRLERLRPEYVALLRKFAGHPLAPDANATLRITYGTVKGYRPRPGAAPYPAFTTVSEVLAKHTGQPPFDAPEKLRSRITARDFGPYADPILREVPVNFVADLHIAGGNSGSPTFNAAGELVGLAFDGNYEAMASDWLFMPELTRSIHVDIRYVLWLMDAVDDADWILREMGVTPSLD